MPLHPAFSAFAAPAPALVWAVGFAVAVNVGGTAASLLLPGLRGPAKASSRHAIWSWWPVTLVWSAPVLLGPAAAVGVALLVGLLCLHEWSRLGPDGGGPPALRAAALLTAPLVIGAVALGPGPLPFAIAALWGGLGLPLLRLRLAGVDGYFAGAARLAWGAALPALSLAHVPMLAWLPADVGPAGPMGLLAFLLLFVFLNDAVQWMCGKAFGRHPIAPVVSPKKTWEGLLGGLLVNGAIGALIAPALTPFSPAVAFGAAVGLSLLGFFGDLMESAIKRDAGVKDSGDLLPGQGGALDRHDSLLACAPVYTWALLLTHGAA
jgi:phosphatidate cytidylyltransferase